MRKAAIIFSLLCFSFLLYSFNLYFLPPASAASPAITAAAHAGQLTWQKYNCQACHQLYGLGGYLGPDLTNTCNDTITGFEKIRIMVQHGSRQMPSFRLSESEVKGLQHFLCYLSVSGNADPRSFDIRKNGMIIEK